MIPLQVAVGGGVGDAGAVASSDGGSGIGGKPKFSLI